MKRFIFHLEAVITKVGRKKGLKIIFKIIMVIPFTNILSLPLTELF